MDRHVAASWSHPSLDGRPPEYTVTNGYVLRGRTIVAYLLDDVLLDAKGNYIGEYESPAHAMLMAMRHLQS